MSDLNKVSACFAKTEDVGYPTAWAYEQACKALETKNTQLAEALTREENLKKQLEEALEWKRVLLDANVVDWSYSAEHENNPHKALQDLLAAEAHYLLDPCISAPAAYLELRAKAAALYEVAERFLGVGTGIMVISILKKAAKGYEEEASKLASTCKGDVNEA